MPGKPAARLTDMHTCPMFTGPVPHVGGPILAPGAPTVLIGKLPAARVTDTCVCVGPPDIIILGAFTTLIGKLPAARIGDMTAHGGVIVLGCFTVLIGDAAPGSPAALAGASAGASASAGLKDKQAQEFKQKQANKAARDDRAKKGLPPLKADEDTCGW